MIFIQNIQMVDKIEAKKYVASKFGGVNILSQH